MDTVVAKILIGGDENGYMYPHSSLRPDVCPVCKNRIKDVPNLGYKVKRKSSDVIVTHDHYTIVSERFKDFCVENNYDNLVFTKLIKSEGYYFFEVNSIFPLDYVRINTRFINYRECCGSYDEIIGVEPAFKKEDFLLISDDFIYRTEHRFASYAFKHYNIIVGLRTMRKLKEAKLRGLYYDNVYL